MHGEECVICGFARHLLKVSAIISSLRCIALLNQSSLFIGLFNMANANLMRHNWNTINLRKCQSLPHWLLLTFEVWFVLLSTTTILHTWHWFCWEHINVTASRYTPLSQWQKPSWTQAYFQTQCLTELDKFPSATPIPPLPS